ncbi:MAG: hypothetical protein Q7J55_01280 [bacterium]|nr:hypothetical protein [bacterium]
MQGLEPYKSQAVVSNRIRKNMKDEMVTQSGGTGFQPVREFKIYRRYLLH